MSAPIEKPILYRMASAMNKAWQDWFVALGETITASKTVDIDGGAIDGTPIGQTTPAAVKATALEATASASLPSATKIIGTNTGNANLANVFFYESDGTTRKGFVGDAASANQDIYVGSDAANVVLYAGSAARLTATPGGNIGIGTASPVAALNVVTASASTEIGAQFQNGSTGATATDGFFVGLGADNNARLWSFDANNIIFGVSNSDRMRITSAGYLQSGTDSTPYNNSGNNPGWALSANAEGWCAFARYQAPVAIFNRTGNDGAVVQIAQDGTIEGSLDVSGATVSLTGAHLSRWSQWDGVEHSMRPEVLRGTVLSNRDAMCEWIAHEWIEIDTGTRKHEMYDGPLTPGATWIDDDGVWHEIVEETNEQLNRTAVSDVPGDRRVAGVFQAYDQDDVYAPYDFTLAMTGDFVIRIGEGVAVQSGDLLESAGDGTARPQADDIRRAGTIAKVTSTHVTAVYPDGSYLVPCVLMCA